MSLLLLLACLGSYRRKRTELELERSEIVQEQCNAARDQIQEFQAHFVTIAGPRFMAFDRLRSHEECRESDELIVYDLVADVHDASTRGEVFIFFSHQWLGWSEPDPQRFHRARQVALIPRNVRVCPQGPRRHRGNDDSCVVWRPHRGRRGDG